MLTETNVGAWVSEPSQKDIISHVWARRGREAIETTEQENTTTGETSHASRVKK